jgi:isopenicillin N synthase-like dioxygenase
MSDLILDVDLLDFERGDDAQRRAVVDGVMRSLGVGFVYTSHDVSSALLDDAYGMLQEFFALDIETKRSFFAPGTHGQTGYTGLLVETAANADLPDWKEMLNWADPVPMGSPLQRKYPAVYPEQVLPESAVPGITKVLMTFHERLADMQRRFLRIIAVGIGVHETFFDEMTRQGATLSRAIRYPAMNLAPSQQHTWAGAHGDINLITALPRATARGLQVQTPDGWIDAVAPDGLAIINSGIMLEHITNGAIPIGVHRVFGEAGAGERYSVVQFCHPTPWTILQPVPSCITEQRPQRFAAISAGDLLDQVIYDINLVEDARRVAD